MVPQPIAEPIAIIGLGCRFPGDSSSPSKLWNLLKSPHNVASEIPKERFNIKSFYHPDGPHHGSTNVRESYFIRDSDVRHFDAQFFNTPNTEADPMDPQHRQLLEVVYESLEDAGITIEEKQGSDTAVFVGLMCNDYNAISSRDYDTIPTYGATGIAASNASSRVSYFFDWHGTCMTIDTACSSSLIALNQAVQVLRSGASKMAIAAGTNLLLDPLPYVSESNLNMLSPTGRSRMWDAAADGYARGDGVAAVVLKTLSQALADGDTVDCIIRETGANQDGRTKGITMPSGVAQTAMIQDTYARAGLDPLNPLERCQYFEAHGTGTPAGDPQEASALDAAFFNKRKERREDDLLYVGSAKTVIGHTEGTAGMAGVFKAYLAIKNKTLPPNMLFNQLSSGVQPFYTNLQVVTDAQPWPELPEGVPRRVSVNSFGFGGSNAHAILESYDQSAKVEKQGSDLSILPFVLSANSQSSLKAKLESFQNYLENNKNVDMNDLRYSLALKRSAMATKTTIQASSVESLISIIENRLGDDSKPVGTASLPTSSILGVFTGQGAQWATMGSKLIASYSSASQIAQELDASLAELPERPQWTIVDQLSAGADTSRLGEAELSQPLCTAVQIILVNLLQAAGVKFKAVVGHSSGEIGAAYAAGFISASDAIRIAFYRGVHAKFAGSADGSKGAMIAVGTSLEDAQEFCGTEDFEDRLAVAASNSSSSVTLSGDADAIEEARAFFEGEKKFARLLKVDTAYHSHHMKPCAKAYAEALEKCKIQIRTPSDDSPQWFSSVKQGEIMTPVSELQDSYWVDNMVNTVLFSQAVEAAVRETSQSNPLNLCVEVGPHPALKGPTTQTIQEVRGSEISYCGTLVRGQDDLESIASSLGSIWSAVGGIDWKNLQEQYCGNTSARFIKDLPQYDWDHKRVYWVESRLSRMFRNQDNAIHALLGQRIADGTSKEVRWKNILKPQEIKWLSGHALQGQIVFPGTGYMCLAMEASMELAAGRPVQSIELTDLVISKAIAIDEQVGTEIVVSMTNINEKKEDGSDILLANFTSYSIVSRESMDLDVNASGNIRITFGEEIDDVLLSRSKFTGGQMNDVNITDFYDAMAKLGYGYEGPFRGLSSIRRRLGHATGTITRPDHDDAARPLLFHPGMLDSALQTLFAAFCAPGDARLWSLHVPTGIRRVTLVPSLCGAAMSERVSFDSLITASRPNHITGDVDLISADGLHKCIEIDGLGFVPFSAATEADDRNLFSKVTWGLGKPDGEAALGGVRAPAWAVKKAADKERVSLYYLRKLAEEITPEEREAAEPHQKALLDMADFQVARYGKMAAKKGWLQDEMPVIEGILSEYDPRDADFAITRAVGENIAKVVRGEMTTILEVMTQENRLDNFYANALGYGLANDCIENMLKQLAYKNPQMDILEVGAGTGGATRGILRGLGTAFHSYTYTDISTGFFEKASNEFRAYSGRMTYKTLDISKDPTPQGYEEGTYDVVLASNVLHATTCLEETLRNTRKLLKPGGYLVLLEIVVPEDIAIGLIMGGLSGWWSGVDEGRKIAPTITLAKWNAVLKKCGFAGIDNNASTPVRDIFITSVFAAQAVDDQITLYRRPLAARPDQMKIKDLIILGNEESLEVPQVMDDLRNLLEYRAESTTVVSSLDELEDVEVPMGASIISLADVGSSIFKDLTEERWNLLKKLIADASVLLWVGHGSNCEEPYAGATLGFFRSIPYEHKELRSRYLEVPDLRDLSANILAEDFLRLHLEVQWMSLDGPKNVFFKSEPEGLLEKGAIKIQRIMYDTDANARYNSAKRTFSEEKDQTQHAINLEYIDVEDRYALHLAKDRNSMFENSITVRVELSVLLAVRTPIGLAYLSLGVRRDTDSQVMVLSDDNASLVTVPKPLVADVVIPEGMKKADYLKAAACFIHSQQIISRLHSGQNLLIHEADELLASVLTAQIGSTIGNTTFTTTDLGKARNNGWLHIHPRASRRELLKCLPTQVDLYMDLSHQSQQNSLGSRISSALPAFCEKTSHVSLVSKSCLPLNFAQHELCSSGEQILKNLAIFLTTFQSSTDSITTLLDVSDVSISVASELYQILDWQCHDTLTTILEPVDWRKTLFKNDKTYWLVGLAGDLGQSLVDWMALHGAKHVVVSSRNPKVDELQPWIDDLASKDVEVKAVPCDVSSMDSVRQAHEQITSSMPPIAGVGNGALLLRDRIFVNMQFEDLETVLKPKVQGTMNLNEIFNEDTLDWFVAFSSIVGTTGNSGQSNYTAANCFMKAVMQQRRAKGLAGSTIDISRVHGVGYIERVTKEGHLLTKREVEKIERVSMAMSESDLHQLFAEAILSGRPSSGRDGEVVTGIATLTEELPDVPWTKNPKFSHFIQTRGSGADSDKKEQSSRVSVRTQLAGAVMKDVPTIVKGKMY